jgi:hypothetical protein
VKWRSVSLEETPHLERREQRVSSAPTATLISRTLATITAARILAPQEVSPDDVCALNGGR